MFSWLMQVADFMPHGMCLDWRPGLMALHIASDALIALSYFAIPIGIAVFVQRRADLNGQHRALALLFAIFISACGLDARDEHPGFVAALLRRRGGA